MKKENPELPLYTGNDDENDNIDHTLGNFDYYDEDEFDEIYGDTDPGEDEEINFEGIEGCHMSSFIFNLLKMPKPLGYLMPQEKMENFLRERGYKIIKRYSDSQEDEYSVVIKPGSSYIPDTDYSNVREVFDEEVQDILLKWLLKIGKED